MCPPLLAAIPAAIGSAASAAAGAASTISLGTAASLAGTGLSAYGAIQQGQAQKAAADAQAEAYRRQAAMTLAQGEYQAGRQQEDVDRTIGTQIAMTGGSGVDFAGSPSDVIGTTASNGALATGATRYGARVQADNLLYQGQLARQSGQVAQQAGFINAFGSALDGVTRLGRPFGADDEEYLRWRRQQQDA